METHTHTKGERKTDLTGIKWSKNTDDLSNWFCSISSDPICFSFCVTFCLRFFLVAFCYTFVGLMSETPVFAKPISKLVTVWPWECVRVCMGVSHMCLCCQFDFSIERQCANCCNDRFKFYGQNRFLIKISSSVRVVKCEKSTAKYHFDV